VQIGLYLPRLSSHKYLRLIIEGTIRRLSFYILQDPYANAFNQHWIPPKQLALKDRVIGRGGWVNTRNYELDSGAYFLTLLYDYFVTDALYRPEILLSETLIFDAVSSILDTWITEQNHDIASTYRYFELSQNGKGSRTNNATGLTWSGFRPSDDPTKYGYNIPSNIYAAAALERSLALNENVWKSEALERKVRTLLGDIEAGIEKYGVVEVETENGRKLAVYAYEIDGFGGVLRDFDDANVPSLLSIPLLGWSKYDKNVYENTRKRLLSEKFNTFYYKGAKLEGIGSPHTRRGFAWPMGFAVEALTEKGGSRSEGEVVEKYVKMLRQSLESSCNGEMHESVNVDRGCEGGYSREWFEWANAMFVVLVENGLGESCENEGSDEIQRELGKAEKSRTGITEQRGIGFYQNNYRNDHRLPHYYQGLGAAIQHN